jgi:hypothetical protein
VLDTSWAISGGSSPSSSAAARPTWAEITSRTRSHSSSVKGLTLIRMSYGTAIRPCALARASPGISARSLT